MGKEGNVPGRQHKRVRAWCFGDDPVIHRADPWLPGLVLPTRSDPDRPEADSSPAAQMQTLRTQTCPDAPSQAEAQQMPRGPSA